jgi:hypothetical protein
MILADTAIWIDYIRNRDPMMDGLLNAGQIVMHPFVVAEISLGSLHDRKRTLAGLESILEVKVATLREARSLIESHALYSKGVGLTDAHLIASCLITPGTQLWSRDGAMKKVAASLGILAKLP